MINQDLYTIELYRIDVANERFEFITEIITFTGLSFFNVQNEIGGCEFSMEVLDPKALRSNFIRYRTQVVIKRNGIIVWFGPVYKINGSYSPNTSNKITIQCLTYLAHLMDRYVEGIYTQRGVDAGTIAWDLVNTAISKDNGYLGIVQGSIDTIGTSNETLEDYPIGQALINASDNINGYYFEFQPIVDENNRLEEIRFNVRQVAGSTRTDLPKLEIGRNIDNISFSTSGDLYNTITGLAHGTGEEVVSASASSSDLQTGYTRREVIRKYGEVQLEETLSNYVERDLVYYGAEGYDINITLVPNKLPTFDQINLGDTLLVEAIIPGTYVNFVGTAYVSSIAVEVDDNGVSWVTPKVIFNN